MGLNQPHQTRSGHPIRNLPLAIHLGQGLQPHLPLAFGSAAINAPAPSTIIAEGTFLAPSGFGTSRISNPRADAPRVSPASFGEFSNPSTIDGVTFGGGEKNRTHEGSFSESRAGGSSTKPPCKFFAQGYCRFGDSCRFSHGTGDGGMSTEPTSDQSTAFSAMSGPAGNIPFGSSSSAFGGSASSTFNAASPFGSVSAPFGSAGSAPSSSSLALLVRYRHPPASGHLSLAIHQQTFRCHLLSAVD